jgi:hypothetical protein
MEERLSGINLQNNEKMLLFMPIYFENEQPD